MCEDGFPHLMHIWPDQIVELVQDAVNDLHQQMALLILEGRRHQEREDLVEERTGAELAGLVRHLPEGGLSHRGRAVLDLEEELHDSPLLGFLRAQCALIHIILSAAKRGKNKDAFYYKRKIKDIV